MHTNKTFLCRAAAALSLAATLAPAHAGFVMPSLEVTLTGWAYGSGPKVQASAVVEANAAPTSYRGHAGAFTGVLSGAGLLDSASFITYCIEIEESFRFANTPMLGYVLTDGASYFEQRRGDAGIADRVGRLLTYVADTAGSVGDAASSAAMQLAVWNMVYDSDFTVTGPGGFGDTSGHRIKANALLAGAAQVTQSRFDVFALERTGSQDLLVWAPGNGRSVPLAAPGAVVPEPASLALVALALAGAVGAGRRRRAAR
jgi:hypothetical protein